MQIHTQFTRTELDTLIYALSLSDRIVTEDYRRGIVGKSIWREHLAHSNAVYVKLRAARRELREQERPAA